MEKITQKDILLSLLTAPAPASGGSSGGGIVPAGTKTVNITANGEKVEDVTQYEKVKVISAVPVGVFPDGVLEIITNGDYDVTEKKSVSVNVPVGITPEGTKEIVENGVYDVTEFASVDVNVPATGITPEGTKIMTITANGTVTEDVSTYKNVEVTVAVPASGGDGGSSKEAEIIAGTVTEYSNADITSARQEAFKHCGKLKKLDLPNLASVPSSMCYEDGMLAEVNLPAATVIGFTAFTSCTRLSGMLKLPKCITLNGSAFSRCDLHGVDMLGGGYLKNYCFDQNKDFTTLVIRNTTTITQMSTAPSNVFANVANVTVYVPDNLLETYKKATNWSAIAGQIKALSEYVEV